MGKIIDSSVFIAAERGRIDLDALLRSEPNERIAIAAITASELLHGVHRAVKPAQRAKREAFVEHLLGGFPVVQFDLVVARIHADLWSQLASKGRNIGAHDLMIGATAISLGFSVATNTVREFSRIPGLQVVRW